MRPGDRRPAPVRCAAALARSGSPASTCSRRPATSRGPARSWLSRMAGATAC